MPKLKEAERPKDELPGMPEKSEAVKLAEEFLREKAVMEAKTAELQSLKDLIIHEIKSKGAKELRIKYQGERYSFEVVPEAEKLAVKKRKFKSVT
jgi:hypothetical protein